MLITRVPEQRNITGRSQCSSCKTQLQARDLIPVLSFVFSKGKCRTCAKPIGYLYPFVELSSGLLFLLAFLLNRDIPSSFFMAGALWLLFVISVIDFRTQTIADVFSILLGIFGVMYQGEIGTLHWSGALTGVAFFGVIWICSKGKSIGSGDIILAGAIGLLLGSWQMMVACLMATYILGAAIASVLLLLGKIHRKSMIPFAPFFALGALFVLAFQDRLHWILSVYFGI